MTDSQFRTIFKKAGSLVDDFQEVAAGDIDAVDLPQIALATCQALLAACVKR